MITLEEALKVGRQLEPKFAETGLHLALAGSLFYSGTSDKDIDFIVYRHDRTTMTEKDMIDLLQTLLRNNGLTINNTTTNYVKRNRPVFVTHLEGLRIDFLIP